MEELIKEAEKLYKNIDDIQLMWVKSTKDSYEEGKIFAIGLMHATMNSVSQFLKCLIDRKGNIVDLGEVWHEVNNEPNDESRILIIDDKDDWYSLNHKGYKDNDKHWENVVRAFGMTKWAYLKDLLPKGGE